MSEFARELEKLIDSTAIGFTREEWGYMLGVKADVIESWLADSSIPKPYQLSMLVTSHEHMDGGDTASFREMAQKLSTEVSPFGKRMLPTVWEYTKRPTFCELSSKLAKLTPIQQEELLVEMYLKQ